jgi:tetratricopeptide (TPR) repeat protein
VSLASNRKISLSIALMSIGIVSAAAASRRLGLSEGVGPLGFSIPELLVVHLLSTLPLAWALGSSVMGGRIAWGMATACLSICVIVGGRRIEAACSAWELGFVARALLRTIIAASLVFGLGFVRPARLPAVDSSRIVLIAVLLIAMIPPLAFATRRVAVLDAELPILLNVGKTVRALQSAKRLSSLGARRTTDGHELRTLGERLESERVRLEREFAASGEGGSRLEAAFLLVRLDRLDEARSLVAPRAAEGEIDAVLLLAAIERDSGRLAESERLCRIAIRALERRVPTTEGVRSRLETSYDTLVDLLETEGRISEVEQVLRAGEAALPERGGHFALRRGINLLARGRATAAVEQFHRAASIDPRLSSRIEPLLDKARVQSPACLLIPSRIESRVAHGLSGR